MKFKRLFSLLTIITLVATLFSAPMAEYAYAVKGSNDIEWSQGITGGHIYFDPSTGTVTDCYGKITEACIPNEIAGVVVKKIGYGAFSGASYLSSISIPNSVTYIDSYAFYECHNLKEITLPDNLTGIGYYAFYECNDLTNITLPQNVTSIDQFSFAGCDSLSRVTLPNGILNIGRGAFSSCDSLTYFTIPENVTRIEASTFSGCDNLSRVIIPDSVTSIGEGAFQKCSSLDKVIIPSSVQSIENSAFYLCTNLKRLTIFNSETELILWPFSNCKNLTIYGNSGSTAEAYAKEFINQVSFSRIDDGFKLGEDNNSFTHSDEINGGGFEGIKNYNFIGDQEYFSKLTEGLSKGLFCSLLNIMNEPWNGSCYGIAMTMGFLHEGMLDIQDIYNSETIKTYSQLPRPADDSDFWNVVNYYYLNQYISNRSLTGTNSTSVTVDQTWAGDLDIGRWDENNDTLEGFLKNLVEYCSQGHVYLFSIQFPVEVLDEKGNVVLNENGEPKTELWGHSILATGCEVDESKYIVQLYDMNNSSIKGKPTLTNMEILKDFSEFKINIAGKTITQDSYAMLSFAEFEKFTNTLHTHVDNRKPLTNSQILRIQFSANNQFSLSNNKGQFLSYTYDATEKKKKFSGNIPVYNMYVVGEKDNTRIIIETEAFDEWDFTRVNGSIDVELYSDSDYASLKGNSIETASFDLGETIKVEGNKSDSFVFTTQIATEGETFDEFSLVEVSGNATADVLVSQKGQSVKASSSKEMKDLIITTFTEENVETNVIDEPLSEIVVGTPAEHSCDWEIESVIKEASCKDEGIKLLKCSLCNTKKTETIPSEGHQLWQVEKKDATCTTDGYESYCFCQYCNTLFSDFNEKNVIAEIPIIAAGHNYSQSYTIDKAASTTENGSKSQHCMECGATTNKKTIYKLKTVKLGATTYVYNGKTKSPKLIIKDGKGNTVSSKNYTVIKSKGRVNVGKYTYKIKFKNEYKGIKPKTLTFKINPKATSITKKPTAAKKAFTVKWKKVSKQATGYQIMYSTSKKFTKKTSNSVKIKNYKTTSKTITGLKSKKTYYVKIRTYKTVNNVKYYSSWSKVKTVKTK